MSHNWINKMDTNELPFFDLGALPDNQDFNFDILNSYPAESGMYSAETNQEILSTNDNNTESKLLEICARLERIEAGMATNARLDSLTSSINFGFSEVRQTIIEVKEGLDKLRKGLENYTKSLVRTFLSVNEGTANIEEE